MSRRRVHVTLVEPPLFEAAARAWLPHFEHSFQIIVNVQQEGDGQGDGVMTGSDYGRVPDTGTLVLRAQFPQLGVYAAPRSPTEVKLADIWRKTFAMDKVGITDEFEELGGDSLLAASMFTEIEAVFAIEVPVGTLARASTIEQLASRIDSLIAKTQ